jgi:hypothetical protein
MDHHVMTKPAFAFVAYPSDDRTLASLIIDATRRANARSKAVKYEPWEYNDISGIPLTSPILERIAESDFIVADITYLNSNVVYEIGFAIGSGKRVYLINHSTTKGDRQLANEVGIFDTIGYVSYEDIEDLVHKMSNHIDRTPIPIMAKVDLKAPIYVVEPPIKDSAATRFVSRLKKARYRYRSFNPFEDSRLSAVDAIRQVASSAGVILSMYGGMEWSTVHNLRSLYVAGLSHGMGKPTLVAANESFQAPLDIRDEVKGYRQPIDIDDLVADFVPQIAEFLQQLDPHPVNLSTTLQSLAMGDPTAENEMTTLGDYYLPTDQYGRTLQGDVNLAVGRKGSGKTALFIQVRDRVRSDKRNIVVDLKPEGYQLLKLKEDILTHLSEGSQHHLITAIWEYLLLHEVAYKILEKDRQTHRYNHELRELYLELEEVYRGERITLEGDFSERLLRLSERISGEYKARYGEANHGQRLTTSQVTELVYTQDIRTLESRISRYLEKKQSVWVLFDNLDKGWSTQGVDDIDVIALRCLIDAGRKIERDMRRAGHEFHCVIFVRNDVYEHLMLNSADYGKEMRAVLDWTDPDQLRELLRLRLVTGLELEKNTPFERIWPQVCVSHFRGEESSTFMIDRSLMRPRNLLKIFGYARGFANNFSRRVITEDDIEKGVRVYSQDLLIELNRELADIFPDADELLYFFMDATREMSTNDLYSILNTADVDEGDYQLVINFLLYYGVIGLRTPNGDQYIFNVNYDPKVLEIRAILSGDKVRYVLNPAFAPALGIA